MAESTFNNPSSFGAFAPTTNVWDVGEIYAADIDPNIKEIMVRLYQNLNLMSILLNLKETGFYDLSEFVNGQLWFPNPKTKVTSFDTSDSIYRQDYTLVVYFPALPNNTFIQIAHNITVTSSTFWTYIGGAATNSTTFAGISLPYVSLVLADNVQVDVDNTYVTITTAADYSGYSGVVVLKYLQS